MKPLNLLSSIMAKVDRVYTRSFYTNMSASIFEGIADKKNQRSCENTDSGKNRSENWKPALPGNIPMSILSIMDQIGPSQNGS